MIRSEFKVAWPWAGLVLPVVLATLTVQAREVQQPPYELTPNLVITPARGAQSPDAALVAISVITREDIEYSVAEDLLELLRLVPGIDIVRSGPAGAQTSVFMRGTNSNHVLVLIDGIRASSTNTGAYAWELLPLNQIERIEIVRGPMSGVYGSDAIGGVIQVFTRTATEPYARFTGGSWESHEFQGGWGVESGSARVSINGGLRDSGGFSAQNADGFAFNPDDDGLEAVNLGISGAHRRAEGALRFSVLAAKTETEFDQGVSDADQLLASLRYQANLRPGWRHEVVAGHVRDRLRSDFGFFGTDFLSRRTDLAWQHEVDALRHGMLRFGLDYTHEAGDDDGTFDENRDNAGVYAAFDRSVADVLLQGSVRLDDNSEFGTEITGQLAIGLDLSPRWRAAASWGSGFRGPNFNEQFSPGFGGLFAGNPDLQPESSHSFEISLRREARDGSFRASVYRTRVDDLVAFAGPAFQATNIERAKLHGIELEYELEQGPWRLSANATFQDTEDRASGEPLPRRPDTKGSITLDRNFGPASWFGLEYFMSGRRSDFGGVRLDSYRLLNARGAWQAASSWRLELRLDNLLDEEYQPAQGFNGAGRSAFLSVAWGR